jgi:hypothetical protein
MRDLKKQARMAEKRLFEFEPGTPEWEAQLKLVERLREVESKGDRVTADGKLSAGVTIGVFLAQILGKRAGFLLDVPRHLTLPKMKWTK